MTISPIPDPAAADTAAPAWQPIVARFQRPSTAKASWQLINSLVPYTLLWVAMAYALTVSVWLMLPLAVLAAGFLARIFIIFHDCGHGSFFKSRAANRVVGFITGLLTLTPFDHWRWQHALHHRNSGDLNRRGAGDIWMLTVQEYRDSSRWRRMAYRFARNPLVLFVIAPFYVFVIHQRFPAASARARERRSVHWMNFAILVMGGTLSAIIGVKAYLLIQIGLSTLAGVAALWLFYVQHQFEGAYWTRGQSWNYTAAALEGSSFYKLPKFLQWFSGNIGFHHIHHLSARIPNYNLERCHNAHSLFAQVKPVTLISSLKSLAYRLWDESQGKWVSFREVRSAADSLRP